MTDSIALRCTVCGTPEVVAVRPGTEPDRALDLFMVERGTPMAAWCLACWPWRAQAAAGEGVVHG